MTAPWLLCRFRDDYADEFDVEAIVVLPATCWAEAMTDLLAAMPAGGFDASFGSNESIWYASVGDYLSRFAVSPIHDVAAATLVRLLGRAEPGASPAGWCWRLVTMSGVLPMPVGGHRDWIWQRCPMVQTPPCKAHGNPVGQCDACPGGRGTYLHAPYVEDADLARLETVLP